MGADSWRAEVATLCERIVEDPAVALRRPVGADGQICGRSSMQKLLGRCTDEASDDERRMLALVSSTAVFLDVLPSYRIREATALEREQKQTKEVYQLRHHEASLLSAYRMFIKVLCAECEAGSAVAVRCLGQLAIERPRFNLTEQVLRALAAKVDSANSVQREEAVCAFRELISRDARRGDAALAAVRAVGKIVKDCRGQLRTDGPLRAIETVETRACDSEERTEKVAAAALAESAKRKKRAAPRKTLAVRSADVRAAEKSMREASATVDQVEVEKDQRNLAHEVSIVYARVLKAALGRPTRSSSTIVSAACRGLRRVASAVNVDVLGDAVAMLEAAADDDKLPPAARLDCAAATLALLETPGYREALGTDLVDDAKLVDAVYAALLDSKDCDNTVLVALEACLLKRHRPSAPSVAGAFARRLLQLAAHAKSGPDQAFISFARLLAAKFPRDFTPLIDLDDEPSPVGLGAAHYRPLHLHSACADALALPAWELHILARHFDPNVARISDRILAFDLDTSASDHPLALLATSISHMSDFPPDPPLPTATKHLVRSNKRPRTNRKETRAN